MKTQSSEIKINSITKETEKAICVNVTVCWGDGGWKLKDVWFPKSTCEVGEKIIMVADWMIEKTCKENSFKGYEMSFPMCSNSRFSA